MFRTTNYVPDALPALAMPFFVGLYKFTDQGRKSIKDSPNRFRQAIASADKAGIKIHYAFYVSGQYDLITISEAPTEEAAVSFGLGVVSQGNVVGETLHAYSIEQVEKMVSRI